MAMSAPAIASAATSSSCAKVMAAVSNGVWQGDNPVRFALPLLIVQICLVLAVTRLISVVLKPLRQPRVIAEIIGGILLGPSALGRSQTYLNNIFPKQSITVLDTVADLGLIFFLFLVGLELDLRAIKKTGKQALSIAAAGISVPFVAGVGVSVILHKTISTEASFIPFLVFMGVAMSITAFPVLARILAERKLLTTDVGQMAMSAAAVNDVAAWILLALAVALSGGSGKSPMVALWVLLCGVAFCVVMFVIVRPLMARLTQQQQSTGMSEPVNELHVAVTLAGILISGLATDAVGIHAIFGAFVFGLIIPKDGPFAGAMIEKMEDLVTTLMLPLYFASSGLKTNIGSIHSATSFALLMLVVATACIGKILGTVLIASSHRMDFRKSLTLGFLMNTKGLVELIVLNIGKDRKVLNDETFAIMVLMALITTFITTPTVMALYKPARKQLPYDRRVLYSGSRRSRGGSKVVDQGELRVLACVHGMPNVHAIINLVEAARGTRKETLRIYILHLLQLTERPSSIMKVQKLRRNGLPSSDCHDDMDSVVLAFEAYGQLSKVAVKAMSGISNFEDMHEDICAVAAQKRAAFIVIPFHKHARRLDGVWEGSNPGLRSVNLKVLTHAPCSVGILVDRGIGIASLSSNHVNHNVAVLFYGGPDDREALAFAYRMVEHPGVRLKVFRFVQAPRPRPAAVELQEDDRHHREARITIVAAADVDADPTRSSSSSYDLEDVAKEEEEQKLDAECLEEVILKAGTRGEKSGNIATAQESAMGSHSSNANANAIEYEERCVSDIVEGAVEVGKMKEFTLVVVGRGSRRRRRSMSTIIPASSSSSSSSSSVAVSMSNSSHSVGNYGKQKQQHVPAEEFPELGRVGDALVRYSHHTHSSILVIQRHDPSLEKNIILEGGGGTTTTDTSSSSSSSSDWNSKQQQQLQQQQQRKLLVDVASFSKTDLLSRRMLVATGPRASAPSQSSSSPPPLALPPV